jgi:hypothetical protein
MLSVGYRKPPQLHPVSYLLMDGEPPALLKERKQRNQQLAVVVRCVNETHSGEGELAPEEHAGVTLPVRF